MSKLTYIYKEHFDTLDSVLKVEAENALKEPKPARMKAIIGTKRRREESVVGTPANAYLNDEARVSLLWEISFMLD